MMPTRPAGSRRYARKKRLIRHRQTLSCQAFYNCSNTGGFLTMTKSERMGAELRRSIIRCKSASNRWLRS
jgi:hypothetical protein